jgi:hypothetical protein
MDKKETDGYEEEKETGSEVKMTRNEIMEENEKLCPLENILFCLRTFTVTKHNE